MTMTVWLLKRSVKVYSPATEDRIHMLSMRNVLAWTMFQPHAISESIERHIGVFAARPYSDAKDNASPKAQASVYDGCPEEFRETAIWNRCNSTKARRHD